VQQMVDRILEYPERTKMQILAPVVSGRKGEHANTIEKLKQEGYVRIRVDQEMREVTDDIQLDKNKNHSIEVVVDRIIVKEGVASRLSDSIETDRKSTRLNSSHVSISYAVFCLKKKKQA